MVNTFHTEANNMSQFDLHSPLFHWQGRHDAEDGKLGQRIHHVVQRQKADELSAVAHGVSLLGFARLTNKLSIFF